MVDANILAAKAKAAGNRVYNIGTGESISINRLAEMVGGDIVYTEKRPAEVYETLADIESTIKEIGWKPKVKIEEIINEY